MIRIVLLALLVLVQDVKDLKVPFAFGLYGDCRDGHAVHRSIVAQLARADIKFVLQTGDVVQDGNNDPQWTTYRQITKDLRAKMPYLAVKGNHDKGNKDNFEREFGLKETYFEKVMGPIHLFFLDSNRFDERAQLAWLESRAAASRSAHKIAVFHHTPYTLVSLRVPSAKGVERVIHGLLVKHKFCAALVGHDHNFYMTRRDGVAYVVSGGGGAPLYDADASLAQKGDLWRKTYHFVIFSVKKDVIEGRVFDERGAAIPDLSFKLCGK